MTKNYDWKRYWYSRGGNPLIINGFLYVFEYTKDVFSLDSVSNIPCLVLRGEPGMGKSREIEKIYESQITDEFNEKLYFNLSSYGDESRLIREIFGSGEIQKWKEGDRNLYLYLDSLDEVIVDIKALPLSLADEIEKIAIVDRRKNVKKVDQERRTNQIKLSSERLFLRIACRTAEWSNISFLENKLKEIWKEGKCQVIDIAPLQQKDVENAAQTEQLDSGKFLTEIYNKNVPELASTPFDLQFLLSLFRKDNSLPSTRKEIYEKGCLIKCKENNERRKAAKRIGKLMPEQRFRIASRIAALMIFGNKSSIWIDGNIGEEESSNILVSELSGYSERRKDDSEFQVTEEEIQEVFSNTSLFTGNGNNRLKFSHQTFAEFLASSYLEYKKLSDETIIEIIGEKYLYPQLYETAAWSANQRLSIFQHLMKIAPTILLRSDIILAEDSTKEQLVRILLNLFDKEESEGIDRTYYRKLTHPKLAEQIRPYIIDKTKRYLVRSEAIDIAQVCGLKELQDDLANIALDKEDDLNIRVYAAFGVTWIGDSETKKKLRPLVIGKVEEDDKRFRLKGIALDMLWNEHLTAKELFSVLSPPNNHFTGSYEVFLDSEMIEKLRVGDLPIALDWLVENIEQFLHRISSERKLADKILLMAWENLDERKIFEGFIKVTNILISHHDAIFKEIEDKEKINEILQDNDKRRKIWLELFPLIDDNHYWSLEESEFIGLRSEDISWLAQKWSESKDEVIKAKLLSRLKDFVSYWGIHPDVLDEIFKVCDKYEELKKEFEGIFAEVELNTEKAKKLKEDYEESTKWRREQEKQRKEWEKPASPSPLDSTLKSLEKFEGGEINAFINVNYYLMFLPNGRSEKSEFEADLTKLPVWKDADEDTKSRIVKAAKKYVEKGNPEDEQWIGTESYQYSALTGFKALVLINEFEPEYINKLTKNIWEKWAAIIYCYPNQNSNEEYERHRKLIAKAYQNAPLRIIELLKQNIESDTENKSYWSLEKLKYCWDERLKTFLKDKIKNFDLSVYAIRKILSELFELNDTEVEKISCDFIKFPIPDNEKERELLMIAVELIISHGAVNCWEKIWHILERDDVFGIKMIEYGCFRFERAGMQNLSEKQLADIYLWLSEKYPHKDDPIHYGVFSPGFRDKIVNWRESLLSALIEKGNAESVNEVERIKNNLPQVEWLKRTVLRAQEKRKITSWQPHSPQELLELFCNVRNAEKSSFENIERKLDLLLSKMTENQTQIMEQLADFIMSQIEKESSKLNASEIGEFKEVKKGKWETKLKFVIPLIPKIPYLGEFFPSASVETTKTIESDEYVDLVQRKLYGDKLLTNIIKE